MFINPIPTEDYLESNQGENLPSIDLNEFITLRLRSDDIEQISPFTQWILNKRERLRKKKCLLTKLEYYQLTWVTLHYNNYIYAQKSKELRWIIYFIKNHNIHRFLTDQGDIIKNHEIVKPHNDTYLRIAFIDLMEKAIKEVHIVAGHKNQEILI
jgi:hypothetical protein